MRRLRAFHDRSERKIAVTESSPFAPNGQGVTASLSLIYERSVARFQPIAYDIRASRTERAAVPGAYCEFLQRLCRIDNSKSPTLDVN